MKLKKFLAGFMTLCMLVTAVPVTAMAEEMPKECTDKNCAVAHVAVIGTTHYDTLQAAVEAADDEDVIKVIDNITIDGEDTVELGKLGKYETLVKISGKSITVDLNGNTLYCEADKENGYKEGFLVGFFATTDNGHLTLVDSAGNGVVEIKDTGAGNVYALLVCFEENSSITVESGNYKIEKILANGRGMIYSSPGNNFVVNGGTFWLGNVASTETGFTNASPWIFNAGVNASGMGIKVNGGTFNFDINHQYYTEEVCVPEDKALKDNGDTWKVVDAVAYVNEQEYVKQSDWYDHNVGYATLKDAIATANIYDHKTYNGDGYHKRIAEEKSESITLLKDCVLSSDIGKPVKIGETVIPLTINGEGKTITVDKNITISQTITVNGDLTLNAHGHTVTSAVKDGESNPVAPFSMGEGAELTIIGGTFNFDPTDYLPEKGCAVEENEGLYKIVPAAGSKAIIGSVGYENVEDALAAAKQGDTIEVPNGAEKVKVYDGKDEKDVIVNLPEGSKLVNGENGFEIIPESDDALAVTVGSATVTVPAGESITVNPVTGKVTLPDVEGNKIVIGDKEIAVGEGGATITPEGEVTLPKDSVIEEDGKTITVGDGEATIESDGDIILPKDSVIEEDGKTITVGNGKATVESDGEVELPAGSKIEVDNDGDGIVDTKIEAGKDGATIESGDVTVSEGSQIEVDGKEITVNKGDVTVELETGDVTVPAGSEIEVDDKTITVGEGGNATIEDGVVTLPEDSKIVIEGEDGDKTEIIVGEGGNATIEDGEVTVPAGSQIVVDGDGDGKADKTITVGEGGSATIEDGEVTVPAGSQIIVDDNDDGVGDKTIAVGNGNATIEYDGDVNLPAGSKVTEDGKETVLKDGGIVNQDGTVSMPDTTVEGTQVYAPEDGNVTVNSDGSVTVPTGGTVVINGETIEVTDGSVTVKPDGTVTVPEDSAIKKGDTEIKAVDGDLTVDNDGKVTVPAGGTVEINGTTVTLPEGGTVDANGEITADKVVIGDATVTPPEEGGKVTVEGDDKVTIPEGSKIEIGDETIIVNKGEVTIDQDGNTVTVPEGSEVEIGGVTVKEGEVTVEPADNNAAEPEEDKVTISAGSEIEVDGKDITVGEGGATITPEGEVILPAGSEIEIGEDTKITVGEGGTTITPEEEVILPEGSKIEIGENTEITVGDGEGNDDTATINPETGEITLPEGSKIETGEDTEITVGDGGASIDPDGTVTLPEGSQIEVGGTEIIVGDGEGNDDTVKIDPENGTVVIPEGSTITQGNGTVIESVNGDLTLDDNGNVVIPGGGTVNVDGRPTVFPNGGGIDTDGTVNVTPSTGNSGNKSSKKYEVSIDANDVDNGSVKLSPSKAKKGATVTITVTPDEGYKLDKLVVLDKDGNEVELTDKGDGKFTFKMPRGGVEVDASFVEAGAADKSEIVLTIDSVVAMVNGEPVVNDVAPIIKGERTFLPIRLIAEELGATVTWNEADQSVLIAKDDMTIVIYIGQAFALVNGSPVALDEPAFIVNSRTYLPLRFIAEELGAEVIWDGASQTVTVVGKA